MGGLYSAFRILHSGGDDVGFGVGLYHTPGLGAQSRNTETLLTFTRVHDMTVAISIGELPLYFCARCKVNL